MKTVQGERDYAYGAAMLTLRTRIGLTQEKLADRLGIARLAVCRWEAGSAYPKPEHLKALMALAVQHQAFPTGSEAEEIRALWELAHQKVLLDERWLSALLSQRTPPQGEIAEIMRTTGTRQEIGDDRIGPRSDPVFPYSTDPKPGADPVPCSNLLPPLTPVPSMEETMSNTVTARPQRIEAETIGPPSPTVEMGSAQDAGSVQGTMPAIGARANHRSDKTRGRRKRLLVIVIALVILTIIGSAGALLFSARNHSTDQTYPGYLSGHGTLVFFDPLSQERGSQWPSNSNKDTTSGGACQFTGGAYHVSQPVNGYFTLCHTIGVFSNFAFEVQLTITQGDCGGIAVRMEAFEHFYYLLICQNSDSSITKFVGIGSSDARNLYCCTSSAVHTGLGHQNKLAVVANGSIMTFYVNEQQIDQKQDNSYTSGWIALTANPYYNQVAHTTEVTYSNARLWRL